MNMKQENKAEIKQKKGFAMCFTALLALCAVSAVYGNETARYDNRTAATSGALDFEATQHASANRVDFAESFFAKDEKGNRNERHLQKNKSRR